MANLDSAVEFSIRKARQIQNHLAKKVISEDRLPRKIDLVAGADVAYFGNWTVGTVTVFKYDTLGLLEIQTAKQNVRFPYIPTLFAFREFPVIDACIKKLHFKPEVVLVDGHGQTHPLNCGLASHLGVLLNLPTIGVAKSRLVGEKRKIGDRVFLVQNENIVGEIVTTSKNRKPVYVSIGHMVSLRTAVDIVRNTQKHRIPEPIRWAHIIASKKIKDLN